MKIYVEVFVQNNRWKKFGEIVLTILMRKFLVQGEIPVQGKNVASFEIKAFLMRQKISFSKSYS